MEDFQQTRKDREAIQGQHLQSLFIINRLERELNETKEKSGATDSYKEIEQLQEEIMTSNSQIAAYEKQLDDYEMELNEWRRRGQVMQDRIDALDALQEQYTKPIIEVYVH